MLRSLTAGYLYQFIIMRGVFELDMIHQTNDVFL